MRQHPGAVPRVELHPHFNEAIALELDEGLLAVAPAAPRLGILERFEEGEVHVPRRRIEPRIAHGLVGLGDDHRGVVRDRGMVRALDGIVGGVGKGRLADIELCRVEAATLRGARRVGGAGTVVAEESAMS